MSVRQIRGWKVAVYSIARGGYPAGGPRAGYGKPLQAHNICTRQGLRGFQTSEVRCRPRSATRYRVPSGNAPASAMLAALGLRHRPQRGPRCKRAQRMRGAQMPNDKDSSSDHAQSFNDGILRNFSLLALPWLSFQRDMLAIMKKGIEDTSHARPVQKLTLLELHALMMVMDPSRTWRGPFDADLEKRVEETYKETFPKLVSGSIQFIEVQDILLKRMSDALNTLKDGNKTKSHSK